MAQLGLMALAFGGIPAAMLAWRMRLISPVGISPIAIAWYMLGWGSALANWDLRHCLAGLRQPVIRIDDAGRTVIESRACWSNVETFFLATGLGMVVAGIIIATSFIADRSTVKRRTLLAVAGLLSVSAISYAISRVGLIVAAISPPILLVVAAKGGRLRGLARRADAS